MSKLLRLLAALLLTLPLTITAQEAETVEALWPRYLDLQELEDGKALGVRGEEEAAILAAKLYMFDVIMMWPTPEQSLLSNLIAKTNVQNSLSQIDRRLLKLDAKQGKGKAFGIGVGVGAGLVVLASIGMYFLRR